MEGRNKPLSGETSAARHLALRGERGLGEFACEQTSSSEGRGEALTKLRGSPPEGSGLQWKGEMEETTNGQVVAKAVAPVTRQNIKMSR